MAIRNNTESTFMKTHIASALNKLESSLNEAINQQEVRSMELNMKRILFLRTVPLFSDIEGNDLKWINAIITEKEYSKGEIIFKENDEGNSLYIIEKGSVRVLTGLDKQITLAVLQDRECFGEMSIIDREPRSATVEVIKDAKFLIINQTDFHELLLARPKIAFSLIKTLNQRLRSTLSKLSSMTHKEYY